MTFLRETAVVARYELAAMLGPRGILVLAGYGTISLGIGAALSAITQKITSSIGAAMDPATAKAQIMAELAKPEAKQQLSFLLTRFRAEALFDAVVSGQMPWLATFVLLLSSAVLSGLVFMAGYERISSDLTTGFSRYLFLRVRRESYLAGKLLGLWAGVMACVVIVHVALIALGGSSPGFDAAENFRILPKVWVGLSVFVLGYGSLTLAASSMLGRPFVVLALGSTILFGLWILSFFTVVGELWMGNWDAGLLVADPKAIAVFLAHAIVGLAIAWYGIARRDV
ncbi:MAG: hypothetical protein HY791_14780 [Deltaproteobacteria bacterium]|nr:hypothetical protein [Deltaproteobacteria bacterium]